MIEAKIMDIIRKLEEMIRNGEEPYFEIFTRGRDEIIYDANTDSIVYRGKKIKRRFLSTFQTKKFLQTLAILRKILELKRQQVKTSIRGLFYQLKYDLGEEIDEVLFEEQEESNELIEEIEMMLNTLREDLNLTSDRRGILAGPIIIEDYFGGEKIVVDGTKQGRSGWAIPSDVDNGMEIKEIDADYVLVVEKDAIWQRLNEEKFWEKNKAIIITPKGQPSRGTRRLIRKLEELGLPIFVFTDADPWGWYIYWVIKKGSINLSFIEERLTAKKANFIGMYPSDIERYPFLKKLTITARDEDIKKAREMLSYPWIKRDKRWQAELEKFIEIRKKVEQDALQAISFSFLSQYVKEKVGEFF